MDSRAGCRKLWADREKKAWAARRARCTSCVSLSRSVSHQKNLVKLSFLPGDTGRPDVFPASLGLPLLKQEERQLEAEERDHEGEKEQKKNQKRKEKNQKGQEEAPLPSKEKSEPQKPRARKQGKRPRLESGSEQVCPQGGWPPLT